MTIRDMNSRLFNAKISTRSQDLTPELELERPSPAEAFPGQDYLELNGFRIATEGYANRSHCGFRMGPSGILQSEIVRVLCGNSIEYAMIGGGNLRQLSKQAPVSAALRHAFNELTKMNSYLFETGGTPLSNRALSTTVDLLTDSLTRLSIYPSLSDDGEGGLFIEWWADGVHLSVEVDAAGGVTIIRREPATGERQEWAQSDVLRGEVARLTDEVRRVAPNWREHFDGRTGN